MEDNDISNLLKASSQIMEDRWQSKEEKPVAIKSNITHSSPVKITETEIKSIENYVDDTVEMLNKSDQIAVKNIKLPNIEIKVNKPPIPKKEKNNEFDDFTFNYKKLLKSIKKSCVQDANDFISMMQDSKRNSSILLSSTNNILKKANDNSSSRSLIAKQEDDYGIHLQNKTKLNSLEFATSNISSIDNKTLNTIKTELDTITNDSTLIKSCYNRKSIVIGNLTKEMLNCNVMIPEANLLNNKKDNNIDDANNDNIYKEKPFNEQKNNSKSNIEQHKTFIETTKMLFEDIQKSLTDSKNPEIIKSEINRLKNQTQNQKQEKVQNINGFLSCSSIDKCTKFDLTEHEIRDQPKLFVEEESYCKDCIKEQTNCYMPLELKVNVTKFIKIILTKNRVEATNGKKFLNILTKALFDENGDIIEFPKFHLDSKKLTMNSNLIDSFIQIIETIFRNEDLISSTDKTWRYPNLIDVSNQEFTPKKLVSLATALLNILKKKISLENNEIMKKKKEKIIKKQTSFLKQKIDTQNKINNDLTLSKNSFIKAESDSLDLSKTSLLSSSISIDNSDDDDNGNNNNEKVINMNIEKYNLKYNRLDNTNLSNIVNSNNMYQVLNESTEENYDIQYNIKIIFSFSEITSKAEKKSKTMNIIHIFKFISIFNQISINKIRISVEIKNSPEIFNSINLKTYIDNLDEMNNLVSLNLSGSVKKLSPLQAFAYMSIILKLSPHLEELDYSYAKLIVSLYQGSLNDIAKYEIEISERKELMEYNELIASKYETIRNDDENCEESENKVSSNFKNDMRLFLENSIILKRISSTSETAITTKEFEQISEQLFSLINLKKLIFNYCSISKFVAIHLYKGFKKHNIQCAIVLDYGNPQISVGYLKEDEKKSTKNNIVKHKESDNNKVECVKEFENSNQIIESLDKTINHINNEETDKNRKSLTKMKDFGVNENVVDVNTLILSYSENQDIRPINKSNICSNNMVDYSTEELTENVVDVKDFLNLY